MHPYGRIKPCNTFYSKCRHSVTFAIIGSITATELKFMKYAGT